MQPFVKLTLAMKKELMISSFTTTNVTFKRKNAAPGTDASSAGVDCEKRLIGVSSCFEIDAQNTQL